jgi:hypothetical protein
VATRAAATQWILLRHSGEQEGIGVVRWGTQERERFHGKPGTQAAKAIAFADAVVDMFPDDKKLAADVDAAMEKRPTSVGRLVADPELHPVISLREEDGRFLFDDASPATRSAVRKIFSDFAGDTGVSAVEHKDDRHEYITALRVPPTRTTAPPPTPKPEPPLPAPAPAPRTPREPRPGQILKSLRLNKMSARISSVLTELRKLAPETYPSTTGVMLRVLVELVIDQFYTEKSWTIGSAEFKTKIKRCVHEVDPTDRDPKWQQIRTGLSDGTSLHSINTLHAYVHSHLYHPKAGDVRALAAMFEPFLQAMNDSV